VCLSLHYTQNDSRKFYILILKCFYTFAGKTKTISINECIVMQHSIWKGAMILEWKEKDVLQSTNTFKFHTVEHLYTKSVRSILQSNVKCVFLHHLYIFFFSSSYREKVQVQSTSQRLEKNKNSAKSPCTSTYNLYIFFLLSLNDVLNISRLMTAENFIFPFIRSKMIKKMIFFF
jgi:hypothetical protein